ncbi:MAG: hypothetical protein ACOH2R_27020 [Pseudomonas sp.]
MTDRSNDEKTEAALSRYRRFLRIEATLLIAGTLGAFTLNGYVYLEKYYLTLNVSIDRLNFGAQKLAAYGGASITTWVAASLFGIAAALLIAVLLALSERPGKQPSTPPVIPSWMIRVRDRASELSVSLKVTAVALTIAGFCLASWYLTMSLPSEAGRKAALDTAAKCRERTLTYRNLDRIEACQVAESDDMLFLLKRTHLDESGVSFHTIEVPKGGLIKSETQEEVLHFDS